MRNQILNWLLLVVPGLLLSAVLLTGRPASATDPLGTASMNQVSCRSVDGDHGVPNGVCYKGTVSCPGISDIPVAMKVNSPRGDSTGTVLFNVGGGGYPWYDVHFTYGALAIENVLAAGYATVQFNFDYPPLGRKNASFAGWMTGPGGPRALACRWATLSQWVHDNIGKSRAPFCATGNSGAAGAASYALAFYGMGSTFNMLEQTSGPPFDSIPNGCLCNTAAIQTPCGQGALSECFLSDAEAYLDPAYNNTQCSTAEITHRSSWTPIFLHDSLTSSDATFSYPTTNIHFVFGGLDTGSAVPQAVQWNSQITANGSTTISCVADAPHEIADVRDGATQISDDIIANCH
jgi:hypothetical protein